jgi:multiple sugar transport system permease protein
MFEELNQGFTIPSPKTIRQMSPGKRREMRDGLLYISPWLIGFIIFTLLPMIASLFFSVTDINLTDGIFSSPDFVGLENYVQLFQDPQIWTGSGSGTSGSFWITIKFGLISLPVMLFLPLFIAVLMNSPHLKGSNFFRSAFYLPYIIPFVAAIFLWGGMLNPETGWINRSLIFLGMPKDMVPTWANSTFWVYPTYVIMGIWGIGNAMLIFIAGLQGVPTSLYEAASIDGATGWKTFWNVTFPMISPVVFYNLVLGVVALFQFFLVPLVVNNGTGAPGGASMFFNLYLYKTFFTFQNMSYGAAMAWLLFAMILVVTVLLFSTSKYWVYYAGDGR